MIKVVAALIENYGKVLIARRLTGNVEVINKKSYKFYSFFLCTLKRWKKP